MQDFHLLSFLTGLILGCFLITLLYFSRKSKQSKDGHELDKNHEQLQRQLQLEQEQKKWLETKFSKEQEKWDLKQEQTEALQKEAVQWKERYDQLSLENKKLSEDQKDLAEHLQLKMKSMSESIFENQSKKFREDSGREIQNLLTPLKDKINQFEKKVGESYDRELRDKISLREEIRKLSELNQKVSDEANHLAKALKGDVKAQGSWGELILERVLELSGLIKGDEFRLQISQFNAEGKRIQPDAVIDLPDGKHIIVDSKVSLIAYDRYLQAEDEEDRQFNLSEHISSIRRHIKDLGEKRYETAKELNSPEMVLLFMPIEAAYMLAVQKERDLLEEALKHQIILVCPSTLLATMKTVASLWKLDRQNRHAEKIAHESGLLYNKFVGFVSDLKNVDTYLSKSKDACDQAFRKLKDGPGNLIGKVEGIKKLGAKTNKQLPSELIDKDSNEDDMAV